MREKSQLEDMRAAVRGDIERARARREADPWRAPEPAEPAGQAPEGSVPTEAPEPELEAESIPEPEAVPEPETVAEAVDEAPDPESIPEEAPEPQPRKKGLWARLFGRG